jgi:RNA polymerase sigma-70 factor (ECF subfamily)
MDIVTRHQPESLPERSVRWRQAIGGAAKQAEGGERFNDVVLPHLQAAYRLARALTGNQSDAQDVVQDTCVRAFRAVGTYSGGNPRAWLLTIVRRVAYDWLHKNRPAAIVLVEDLPDRDAESFSDADGATPEGALIVKTEATLLEDAIAALPPLLRETLMLRDVEGLAYREIAAVTGAPIGTVMSRLARGRGRLIAALATV